MAQETQRWGAETRLLFRTALGVFTVTVLIGMFNSFHFIKLSREVLLTHVHSGTLGFITLTAFGAAMWLYGNEKGTLDGHARGITMGAAICIPLYVLAFLSGVFLLKAIAGTLVLLLIVGYVVLLLRNIGAAGWSVPRLGVLLAFTVLIIGSTLGVLIQVQGTTGGKFLPDGAVGGHASAQVGGYLVLFALSTIEWRLRGNDGFGWGGRIQAIFLFIGGVLLAIGVLYNIQPLLGIFIPLDIIALVIFLVRLGPRIMGAGWLEAGSARHYAIGAPWVAVNLGLTISVVVVAISKGFNAVDFNILIAADHAIFLGVMANLAFGLMHDFAGRGQVMPWAENAIFWGLNVALVGFVLSLITHAEWAEKFFAPVQGIAIIIGIIAFSIRLAAPDDTGDVPVLAKAAAA